jgi:hypothetical protein
MMKYLFFLFTIIMGTNSNAQNTCDNPKFHEFDFWMGKWTVYKSGTDTIAGYNEITAVAGGCSLFENYRNADGRFTGCSLNKYDLANGKWQQFWVDNTGTTLHIKGGYANNKMVMENEDTRNDGKTITKNKITWFKNTDGTVRQLWEQSTDGGKNWMAVFDGLYKKAK